ncbi:MAG: hypothetical protein L0206_25400, partial [Actinobacteria bacterium]|nr:hypothetical protein [Actinomycetota bacterium]
MTAVHLARLAAREEGVRVLGGLREDHRSEQRDVDALPTPRPFAREQRREDPVRHVLGSEVIGDRRADGRQIAGTRAPDQAAGRLSR